VLEPGRGRVAIFTTPPEAKGTPAAPFPLATRGHFYTDAELEARLAADANDHAARFDLAQARAARGDLAGAVDHLLKIVAADREWNDQAARKQLLTIFEAAGPASDVARDGRRRLSSLLFA